jgi:hypothetical protein
VALGVGATPAEGDAVAVEGDEGAVSDGGGLEFEPQAATKPITPANAIARPTHIADIEVILGASLAQDGKPRSAILTGLPDEIVVVGPALAMTVRRAFNAARVADLGRMGGDSLVVLTYAAGDRLGLAFRLPTDVGAGLVRMGEWVFS